MRVKICGVCRPQDAAVVAEAGADYIGVILARKGPRQQSTERASEIFDSAGDLLRVGVCADQPLNEVSALAKSLALDVIQLHGREEPSFIHELECETDCAIWKSVALTHIDDLARALDTYADDVDGLLLDSVTGGSGRVFDWNLAREARRLLPNHVQLISAGGLVPENVRAVIDALTPDVVDVASGVEQTVCVKSPGRIHDFIRNAKS